ncbi:MAG: type II and III secretion system protein family protein [Sphingomonas sp.]|nr:type II and III secretion system protein family protein [Sphingomonas sp.]
MTRNSLKLSVAAVALAIGVAPLAAPAQAVAQSVAATPSETLNLSQGTGALVRLSGPMTDVFVANDTIADVQVRSSTQLYVFGKGRGETTVYATGRDGRVVYAANVRVGNNISSVDEMLRMAMPDAAIQATPMNNLVLLTGTVGAPTDVEEAQRLVQAYVGEGTQVVSRLRSATPLQVNLKVRIAEVNRSLLKQIGFNLFSNDTSGGDTFSVNRGDITPIDTAGGGFAIQNIPGGSTLALGGKILGLDFIGALDLLESDGVVSTLAEPNLTALSGETASFLAGGEFPIPVNEGNDGITIEYKQYGVALAFTPIVLSDGRISMRVRPEVSELSTEGAIRLNGFDVPALTTRRAETTVELGSGQSFMLGGLLRNVNTNSVDKAPFLGDLPILGALFRSSSYRRQETELVIVVTPYLVRPVSGRMALPTDGYQSPTAAGQTLLGQTFSGQSGRPAVRSAPAPAIGGGAVAASPGFKL